MKNIFIIPNVKKDRNLSVTKETVKVLIKSGALVYMSREFESKDIDAIFTEDVGFDIELIIVIGGDGSFIDASSIAIERDIPILGINLGRVGYLSEVEPSDLSLLIGLVEGKFSITEKMLLETSVESSDGVKQSSRLAVNDVVISHNSYLGVAEFVVFSNEGGVRYRSDGVVISTPAGSTAYSLSAGGPIVSHDTGAVIVTPIAPHSLFNRSIIFSDKDEIKIKNFAEEKLNISIDGRFFDSIDPGFKCKVKVSDKKIKVVTFKNNNMFSNLFRKMQIVEDII